MLSGMKRIVFHMKQNVRLVKKNVESEICLKEPNCFVFLT
jgi:hypothetical protein